MRVNKTPTAVTPRYSSNAGAGMDLYVDTSFEITLQPGETYQLPTGIRVEIPKNFFGAIYPQPNLHKKGLTLVNAPAIVNSSDRGEIILTVKNVFSDIVRINGQWGLRAPLAQLIIQQYKYEKVEIVDSYIPELTVDQIGVSNDKIQRYLESDMTPEQFFANKN